MKNPPAKIDSKFYLFLAKFNQERPKSSRNGSKRAQHGPKKGLNGAKRVQHCPKGRRKWTKKHKKNDARKKVGSSQDAPGRCYRYLPGAFLVERVAPGIDFGGRFGGIYRWIDGLSELTLLNVGPAWWVLSHVAIHHFYYFV